MEIAPVLQFQSKTEKFVGWAGEIWPELAAADSDGYDEEQYIREMIEEGDSKNEIIFAEYVFLMRAGALSQYLPGDWCD